VQPRRKGLEYYLDHRGGEFFIRANDKGANFRLVRAPVADPSQKHWKQVVAHRPLVMLEEVDLFKDFWVLVERDKGLLKLRVTDFKSGASHYIDFDEAVYTAHPGTNAEYATSEFRFVYESLVTPVTWYDYDVNTLVMAPAGQSNILTNVVEGDLVTMYVEVIGAYSYDAQIGGNTTVPQFQVNIITANWHVG